MTSNAIRPLASADREGFVRLLARNFQPEDPAHFPASVAWKFFDRPEPGTVTSVFFDGGEPCGQYTSAAIGLSLFGVPSPGRQVLDMCVDVPYRGRGIVVALADAAYAGISGPYVSVGFSNAAGVRVDRGSVKYGYHVLGQLSRIYVPHLPWASAAPRYRFSPVDAPAAEIPPPADACQVRRTPAYLRWRYVAKPGGECRLCEVFGPDGRCAGYVAFRVAGRRLTVLDCGFTPGFARGVAVLSDLARSLGCAYSYHCVLWNRRWRRFFRGVPRLRRPAPFFATMKSSGHPAALESRLADPEMWIFSLGDIQ